MLDRPRTLCGASSILEGTHHDCGVDPLSCQGVDVAGGIPNDEQMVIIGGFQALGTQAEGAGLHALNLGIWAQRLADEGVVLDGVIVQPWQVRLLHRTPAA